jgi:hypothetical protein
MAESTPLLDEKQWLDGRTLALKGEIEGLRAPTVGLETGRKGGRPAACDLPESMSGCCRRSRQSRLCNAKEGAAEQRLSEGSPRPPGQFGRIQ